MRKMIISLVIEGNEQDLHEIKGAILATACESLISCKCDIIEEPKKEIEVPFFTAKLKGEPLVFTLGKRGDGQRYFEERR